MFKPGIVIKLLLQEKVEELVVSAVLAYVIIISRQGAPEAPRNTQPGVLFIHPALRFANLVILALGLS